MSGRAKKVEPNHPQWAQGWWYCQVHGRLGGSESAIPEPSFCWHEYRHQCEMVLVHLVPYSRVPTRQELIDLARPDYEKACSALRETVERYLTGAGADHGGLHHVFIHLEAYLIVDAALGGGT